MSHAHRMTLLNLHNPERVYQRFCKCGATRVVRDGVAGPWVVARPVLEQMLDTAKRGASEAYVLRELLRAAWDAMPGVARVKFCDAAADLTGVRP